jgi:hypothetical protein
MNLRLCTTKKAMSNQWPFSKQSRCNRNDQSHCLIAVEGFHPDQHFEFDLTLQQTFPQFIILPTLWTHQTNFYGSPKG